MKEILTGENSLERVEIQPSEQAKLVAFRASISARTQLVWAEHCTECAFPTCYSSCSHYSPRPDLQCRRFVSGIESVVITGVPESFMRIRFRKWGKLEAKGPRPLVAPDQARRNERTRSFFAAVADSPLLPLNGRRSIGTAWRRWIASAAKGCDLASASAFVVECLSDWRSAVPFTLTILPGDAASNGLFQRHLDLKPGHNVATISVADITAMVDLNRPFLVQLEPLTEAPEPNFLFGLVDFVRWPDEGAYVPGTADSTTPPDTPSSKAKCIVWDLDETLWHGTLAEDGPEGVALKSEVIETIRTLDQRGILHSIASKNDQGEALATLERFGIADLFLYPQIGWGSKSQSVLRISQLLDIGVDTLIFVDDQAFERAEVAESVKCVRVFSPDEIETLGRHDVFDVPMTAESSRRRELYRQEETRNSVFAQSGGRDYEGFLRSSNIRLNLSRLSLATAERIYDLSQRTNQVNVSGTRYDLATVRSFAESPGEKLAIVMQCEDRFGDYGIIGFVLLDPQAALVEDYFMSCRVQRKFIEHSLFNHLLGIVAGMGSQLLRCRYRRTQRNKLALEMLEGIGFVLHEIEAGAGTLERGLQPIPGGEFVKVSAPELIARYAETPK
jgi:FkbH-like protein